MISAQNPGMKVVKFTREKMKCERNNMITVHSFREKVI